jgi:ABC-2 type transport system permease protein/capsular polysaccharide transport system permease protein
VRPIDIYLSRLLLEATGATVSFIILTIFFHLIGWLELPEDVLQVIGGWLMIAWFGVGLALLLGTLSEASETVEKLWHPMSYLLFPLSGAAFLVESLPKQAQEVVLWLPMVHGVEFLREGFFGSKVIAHYDLSYMALINLVLTVLGLAQLRIVGRTVTPE